MNTHVTRCVHLITFGFDICNQGIDIWFRDTVNRPALVRMGFSWGHVFDLWIHILSHSTHELCIWHLRSRRPISRHGRAPRPGSLRAQRAESHSGSALSCPSYRIIGLCRRTCAIQIQIQAQKQICVWFVWYKYRFVCDLCGTNCEQKSCMW